MRNLKKILALVLALMMVLSVMVFASATNLEDYADSEQVSEEYAEAVDVLSGMGILKGSEGKVYPQSYVKRAEVSTLIYRMVTGDVGDTLVYLHKNYDKFEDVKETNWFAGFVNYAANNELVKGVGDNKFNPEGYMTGYELITILLRAIGYDRKNEISGSDWKITAATLAQDVGILDGLTDTTLGDYLTREEIVHLIFNALQVRQVLYTGVNYYPHFDSIGEENFGLDSRESQDDWGRPGVEWYDNRRVTNNTYAIIEETPIITYYEAIDECQITDDANNGRDMNGLNVWINGNEQAYTYSIQATDEVTKLGAQGRTTEVYSDRLVMIDTFLAKVTKVTEVTYDSANHPKDDAKLTLLVYDNNGSDTIVLSSETNWSYSEGDMLLISDKTTNAGTLFGAHGNATSTTVYKIHGLAESFIGAQTTIHYQADKHTVEGVTYPDTNTFYLDEAGTTTTNHIWYKDQHNNLIGVSDIDAVYSYGTIDTIQWVNPQGANGYAQANLILVDGTRLSNVTIKAIGDDTGSYTGVSAEPTAVNHSDTVAPNLDTATISATQQNNANMFHGQRLYRIEQNSDGSYTLCTVANTAIEGARLGTDVTVTSKVADVAKGTTGASTDAAAIVMDSSTKYLIQSATGAFTTATGFNNIETYDKVTVDYVDENNDGRVDYVFIVGDPVSAKTAGLFYAADEDVTYSLNTETGVYTINGIFNGAAGSIQVVDPNKLSSVNDLSFVGLSGSRTNYTTAKEFVERICNAAANNHVLLDVTIQSGYVIKAEVVTATAMDLNNENGFTGPYTKLDGIRYQTAKGNEGKYADDVLSISGVNYNVTTATKFIIDGVIYSESALAEGAVYDNHIIHVVYDDASKNATEVYVYSAAQGSSATNPGAPTYMLTFSITGSGKTVTTTGGVVIPNGGTQTTAGSYTFVVYTGYGSSPAVTANTAATVTLDSTNGNAYTYTVSNVTAATTITIA